MKRTTFTMTLLSAAIATAALAQDPISLRIVSIGDSYAAGEGNPNSIAANGTAVWSSTPCHRSFNNGRRMASDRINDLPNVSTIFSDFSCTGAGINEGVLGPMDSSAPETPNARVGAQMTAVTNEVRSPIDILMVSIGGNDVGFAPVVKECMLPTDCRTSPVVLNAIQGITSFLPQRYDALAARIANLNPRFVYITEYPGVLKRKDGAFCGGFDDLFVPTGDFAGMAMRFISQEESEFLLDRFIRPLNDQIQAAAARHGWRYIAGPEDTFTPHGFCNAAGQRWVNTLGDSFLRQGTHTGTAHPNVDGHRAYADALIRRATLDFNLPLEAPRVVDIRERNVGLDIPIASPGVRKQVQAEINQVPSALTATLQFRFRRLFETSVPAFVNLNMTDAGSGRLNLFQGTIPGSESLLPGERIEYRVRATSTFNGQSRTTTTSIRSITLGEVLDQ
ncbi:MAG: SGNH/GDSL hydrolase family protein [Acidobacteria bacterium]|nr:SGNH/GDSL hydrolase family protein [Acidobacteriota bacterium]